MRFSSCGWPRRAQGADAEGLENLIRSALQAQGLLTFRAESGQVAVARLVAVIDVEADQAAVADQPDLDPAIDGTDLPLPAADGVARVFAGEGEKIAIPDLELEILLLGGVPLELDVEQAGLDGGEIGGEVGDGGLRKLLSRGDERLDFLYRIEIQARAGGRGAQRHLHGDVHTAAGVQTRVIIVKITIPPHAHHDDASVGRVIKMLRTGKATIEHPQFLRLRNELPAIEIADLVGVGHLGHHPFDLAAIPIQRKGEQVGHFEPTGRGAQVFPVEEILGLVEVEAPDLVFHVMNDHDPFLFRGIPDHFWVMAAAMACQEERVLFIIAEGLASIHADGQRRFTAPVKVGVSPYI